MKSIMVFNQKGGVGKSTTVGNLMAEFSKQNKRVLGMDLDGQGHLTKFLQVDTTDKNTVYELLKEEADFDETVCKTQYGDLIPADAALQNNMLAFAQNPLFLFRIKTIFESISGKYDIVLMDCPPAINQVTSAGLVAANYLIIPTETEMFSIDGVREIINTVKQIKGNLNKDLKILGILITKYSGRRVMTKESEAVLQKVAQDFFSSKLLNTRISMLSDIPYSQAQKKCVSDYKPNSKSAREYKALADEVLREMEEIENG